VYILFAGLSFVVVDCCS